MDLALESMVDVRLLESMLQAWTPGHRHLSSTGDWKEDVMTGWPGTRAQLGTARN